MASSFIKMDLDQARLQQEEMNNIAKETHDNVISMKLTINKTIQNNELEGKAYESGKNF
ncbi:hypothetical protein [Staphylococcus pettenkoferi]|uniref:hypothetical protein n=1 Tax=Staphylococcus pettenkoferi TaxID=170573 RepID=UPI00147354E1|nr:hypothetical protein [Staphylococcus pettenkoferi]MCI2802564.1 hypothetical protein [Staphylococcus pettenkoferi]MCY1584987.1 hypothetical protein [Staphylococcus pettenkoferi]MCY1616247.1 hypothetical protein [Staphylococcus pettenkoferi]QQC38070.1 hypothetical protein I6I28_04050 [Staphylococcus pettenkoferi]